MMLCEDQNKKKKKGKENAINMPGMLILGWTPFHVSDLNANCTYMLRLRMMNHFIQHKWVDR
jgi:hypothetical protein